MGSEGETVETQKKLPVFRDIRRYCCEYCGISRSKKSLLASHLLTHHKDEMDRKSSEVSGEKASSKSNTCDECGATFQKPAHLKQHMLSHSLEEWVETHWCYRVMHWIPHKELQNARGGLAACYLEWISIGLGDLLRSSFKSSSLTRSCTWEALYMSDRWLQFEL